MRTDRVLGMRNGHNTGAADQTDGRFYRRDAVRVSRTNNAAVCLAPNRYCNKIGGGSSSRAGARAARIPINPVRIVCLPAPSRPTADRFERTKVGPLGQISFAKDD